MIDALLNAVVKNAIAAGWGYSDLTCRIMTDGHPPPSCGDIFLAVHQGPIRQGMSNAMDEYYSFIMTLTERVSIPPDLVGSRQLAAELARRPGPGGSPSFNAKVDRIKNYFHMAWGVLGDANDLLVQLSPEASTVYGFCEPARFRGAEVPILVGGEWFTAEPEAADVGLKADIRFEDCRRFQPLATFT